MKLKPCPFCHKMPKIKDERLGTYVLCHPCDLLVSGYANESDSDKPEAFFAETRNSVIRRWNNVEKPEPCPCCGSNRINRYGTGDGGIICLNCGLEISQDAPNKYLDSGEVLERWNRRFAMTKRIHLNMTDDELIQRLGYGMKTYPCLVDSDDVQELLIRFQKRITKLYAAEQMLDKYTENT